jgi:hypothetical protein
MSDPTTLSGSRSGIHPTSFKFGYVKIESIIGETWDITNLVTELTVKESLNSFSLEYELSIVDSADLFNYLKISGNEKVIISILKRPSFDEDEVQYEFEFYVSNIPLWSVKKNNTAIYKLKGLSKHAYIGNLERISQRFSGSAVSVIKGLIEGNLESTIAHYNAKSSGYIRGIIPKMTVNEAIGWLLNRAYDEQGMPFYVFETLAHGIHVESLSSLYAEHVLEGTYKFGHLYTAKSNVSANRNPAEESDFNERRFMIYNVASPLGLSKPMLAKAGVYASNTLEVDTGKKHWEEFIFQRNDNNLLNTNSFYSPNFKVKGKELKLFKEAYDVTVHKNNNLFANDEAYNSAISPMFGRINSNKERLNNVSQVITIAGDINVHAGGVIDIELPRSIDPTLNDKGVIDADTVVDRYMSGKYLITSVLHTFGAEDYTMTLKIKRDSTDLPLQKGG